MWTALDTTWWPEVLVCWRLAQIGPHHDPFKVVVSLLRGMTVGTGPFGFAPFPYKA
jgi:hypothetical protein